MNIELLTQEIALVLNVEVFNMYLVLFSVGESASAGRRLGRS